MSNKQNMTLEQIHHNIVSHPSNAWAKSLNYEPIYKVAPNSKIVIISQAPGRVSQLKNTYWKDLGGSTLRDWLGVTNEEFFDVENFAILPIDFYYPGKAKFGDLPPRKDFAGMWHNQVLDHLKDVKLIILIGAYAQNYYLPKSKNNLTASVRHFKNFLPKYFTLPHPSPLNFRWQATNPWFVQEVLPILKVKVREIIEK
jgi:uracil-DNA glycosylase